MAFKIIEESRGILGNKPIITAVLDSEEDMDALAESGEYETGSVAVVADTSGISYMVNASGEWAQFSPIGAESDGA